MTATEQLIKNYIPMSEASFLLLSSLLHPSHGYGIMQTVSSMTGGRVNLGAGTVYTILYKMENDGLIEAVSEVERKKIYQITDVGYDILCTERSRIAQLHNIIRWQEEHAPREQTQNL